MQYGNDSFNEALPPTPRRDQRPEKNSSYNDRAATRSSSGRGRRSEAAAAAAAMAAAHSRRPAPVPAPVNTDDNSNQYEMFVRTRRAAMRQLSPTSMATDDEIREEVSSVGMESHTLRPINYPNPFLRVPPPVLEDDIPEEDASEDDNEPSTLSESDDPSKETLTSSDSSDGNDSKQLQQQTRGLPQDGDANKQGTG